MKNFKILSLIVAVLVIFTFTQCDDDDNVSSSKLPESAEAFLASNYPNATYEVTSRKGPSGTDEIHVVLDNGANINFSKSGDVVFVGGKIDTVPNAFIMQKILDYVIANYPTASIVEWEIDDEEQEVELSNNIELVFDLEGNFMYSENDENDVGEEEELTISQLPENIKAFVETHYPNPIYEKIIKETKVTRIKYEIDLQGDVEMDFNAAGELIEIEDEAGIPTAIIPAKIITYVNENFPEALIVEWELDRRKQEIELNNDVELVFDLDANFLYKD